MGGKKKKSINVTVYISVIKYQGISLRKCVRALYLSQVQATNKLSKL